eukprot:CAMPEP_0194265722 /NCGR_PEP_ID=MMETSP0169-20130528/864_1 /TAXON_ID=218684 /ORGANISM="Corethron pennatum, Strain L29A3" /LENGTH=210 /DNA_ID=CAMNT_0039006243 /DNA_START=55 /DNA_END=687 /DNA_ORIENTATION=+
MNGPVFRSLLLLSAALPSHAEAPPLRLDNFYDVIETRPVFVKFYQPWCGHCTRMKPDWDALADMYGSDAATLHTGTTPLVADVNCSEEEELCSIVGMDGFPKLKYYLRGEEHDYDGPRSLEGLDGFVRDNLLSKCLVDDVAGSGCSDKAAAYVQKWSGRDIFSMQREGMRLEGMRKGSMAGDLKVWLNQRVEILDQLVEERGRDEAFGEL